MTTRTGRMFGEDECAAAILRSSQCQGPDVLGRSWFSAKWSFCLNGDRLRIHTQVDEAQSPHAGRVHSGWKGYMDVLSSSSCGKRQNTGLEVDCTIKKPQRVAKTKCNRSQVFQPTTTSRPVRPQPKSKPGSVISDDLKTCSHLSQPKASANLPLARVTRSGKNTQTTESSWVTCRRLSWIIFNIETLWRQATV